MFLLSQLLALGGLTLLSFLQTFAHAKVDPDAPPLALSYGSNGSVGPDGPWWFLSQAVDDPEQVVQLLPSISELSLIVNSDACDDSTTCPLPLPGFWEQSNADGSADSDVAISDDVDADTWDEVLTSLLHLDGRGRFFRNRLTISSASGSNGSAMSDDVGLMLSDSYSSTYPGGQTYTLDTGFFSLYSGQKTVTWSAENGTRITQDRTLPAAYGNGTIPSMSYGLHVGSVSPEVPGSLVLGGFDRSRAIADPIVSTSQTFTLNTMGLSSVGDYKYYGEPEPNDNQLTTPAMDVTINPGAPYLYLPRPTCDKLAEFLPVKYDPDFNLYLWDKSGDYEAFEQIVTSLHFLSFGFASSNNRTQKIKVPFALLNLTLESPLVSEATPYFPCSPLQDGQNATLGRAFLQAALLAQNWQTGRIFLAQAPGPDHQAPESLQTIDSDDTLLTPAANPPSWVSTWSTTLPPWRDSPSEDSSGLSGGVIAGIVVGIIAALVAAIGLTLWCLRRRKIQQTWTEPEDTWANPVELANTTAARTARDQKAPHTYYKSSGPGEIYEAEARPPAQEMDSGQQIGELPAQRWSRNIWKN